MVTDFTDHPAVQGLSSIVFPFVSSIDYTGSSPDVVFTTLAKSSAKSGSEKPPIYFNINRNWQYADFQKSGQTIACLLTGKIVGNTPSKMIVVADADFPVNGEGNERHEIQADNLNFLVNAVEWMGDDTGLNDLRTKEISSRPLDQLEAGTRTFLKYLNFLLPIILILAFGFTRWQYRHTLRIKRMNENYF